MKVYSAIEYTVFIVRGITFFKVDKNKLERDQVYIHVQVETNKNIKYLHHHFKK